MESIGGGSKGKNHKGTAPPGIDPMPLPTGQRGDDMPAEACPKKLSFYDYHFMIKYYLCSIIIA
jgi:hypothetical protein